MELTEHIGQNSREAFAQAAADYGPAMFRAARALLDSDADAEDAMGEALLKAWENWGRLKNPAAARAWLLKITVNCAYGLRRKYGRVTAVEDLETLAGATVDRHYEDLWEAISALPPNYRAVITLFYYEDMPIDEISRVLALPRGTVKSRLSRAREQLKKFLGEEEVQ